MLRKLGKVSRLSLFQREKVSTSEWGRGPGREPAMQPEPGYSTRQPSQAVGTSCSPKGRGRTFDNPVFRLLTGHDKVGLKLELSELGKIENVRFIALLCWGMNYTPVTLLLFLTSFSPSSSFHGPG